jgi:exonuclease SbcC
VRFEGIQLACLTGANGAGKSSLLDAITWALWGRARAKRDDDMIYINQNDMHVQLDFEQEGIIYRVIRKRSRRQRGVGSLDLFAQVDEEWVTQSEPAIRDTQDKINRLLRLDYETFVHSAFLQQGKADAFTTKPPAQRKQILSDILGLAAWEGYEEATKEILKSITGELGVIDMRINEIEKELQKEPQLQSVLVEVQAAQQEAQEALTHAEKRLEEVAHAPAQMQGAQERMADCERHKREHERDLTSIADEIQRQTARIGDYQAIIEAREDIESGYAALQTARETDSALADKLMQLSDFDNQRHELEMQLVDARAELETEASAYEARITELQRALDLADPDELSVVQSDVFTLEEVENTRTQFDERARELAEERANLSGLLDGLETEGKTIRKRLAELKATQEPLCPLCGQPLDEEHREQIIAQLEADIEGRREDYRGSQERVKLITVELKEFKDQMSELDLELKRLQPLRDRASVLQAQIDSAATAGSRMTEEQAKLDALLLMLANNSFAQDIRQQLAALDGQREQIGYDRSSHDSARQQLDTYREYEVRQKQLEVALGALPDVEAALDGARLRQERTLKAVHDDNEKIETLKTEIAQLDVLVKEQQTRQQEVNRLRMFERTQYQRLLNAQQELDALDKQRTRKGELEDRRELKRHEEALYKELRAAFGKNGVPAMIIEAAIPELETSANRLLARMTDGRMSLTFTTQREKAAGDGLIETLDIQISDELGTRSYEMYSGGEAFRINFAIRVALSQLLARRAGAHLRTLFIDEGFGTQDEDGRSKLVEAINAVHEDFALILVITHLEDLRDSFPVHVVVEKTANGSRVSVR